MKFQVDPKHFHMNQGNIVFKENCNLSSKHDRVTVDVNFVKPQWSITQKQII